MADDMAWADVGYHGQKNFETPHIDQMADDGMQFGHAYSGASVCSPSRACLVSGMYAPRHHIYHPRNRARGKLAYMKLAVPNREVNGETYEDQSFKLFDVVNDIGESKDLTPTHPEIAAQLLKELKAWTKAVDAPTPDRINPTFKPNQ